MILPEPSGLDKNTVHLWNISLNDRVLDSPELLANDEMSRYSRFINLQARSDFLRSRVALRLILASYLHTEAAELCFSYSENGKPELVGSDALRFNLSHSRQHCLLVVTMADDVGVDIECLKPGRDYYALARRFYTVAEFQLIEESSDENLFYRMWVLKEAAVKARGLTLIEGLDRFECLINENKNLSVFDKQDQNESRQWSNRQWQPDQHSIAAVLVRCTEAEFIEKSL